MSGIMHMLLAGSGGKAPYTINYIVVAGGGGGSSSGITAALMTQTIVSV